MQVVAYPWTLGIAYFTCFTSTKVQILTQQAMLSMQVVAYPWTLGIVGIVSAVLYLYIGLCALVPIQRFMHWNTYIHRPENPQAKQPKYLKDLFERIKELKTDK